MAKISKSPQRHTFQKEAYLERMLEKSQAPDPKQIEFFDSWINSDLIKEQDPEWQKDNLEYDLRTTDWILQKVREDEIYAQNLYAAMCNNEFVKLEVVPILKNKKWYCSWRHAGGIIADMREEGDYIDWYCSGYHDDDGYVSESVITDEIRKDLKTLGWAAVSFNFD